MTEVNTPQPAGGDASAGWQSFYDSRVQMRDAATDPALKAHFDAELEVARQTMAQMGVTPTGGGSGGDPAMDVAVNAAVPGGGGGEFPEYSDDGTGGDKPVGDRPKIDSVGGSDTIPPELQQFSEQIMAASKATGVPANILCAIIWDESKGNIGAATTNGGNGGTDTGLMQVNPDTFAELQSKYPDLLPPGSDLSDPAINVMAGACYLLDLNQQFGGDWDVTYRAYNSGPLNVNPSNLSDISKYGTGTVTYVDKINYYLDQIESGTPLSDGYPGGNGNW